MEIEQTLGIFEEKLLEEKLNLAEFNLPGVREQLKPYRSKGGGVRCGKSLSPKIIEEFGPYAPHVYVRFDIYRTASLSDVESLQTEGYHIVVAKWEERSQFKEELLGRGIQWEEWLSWLSLYYKERRSEDEIRQLKTERIISRDRCNPDKMDLRLYYFVGVQPLGPTQIEVFWADEAKKKGPTYKVDLESSIIEKIRE